MNSDIYLIGGGPDKPSGIYRWDLSSSHLLASSSSQEIDPAYISKPQPVKFPTTLGEATCFLLSPEASLRAAHRKTAPPLLVKKRTAARRRARARRSTPRSSTGLPEALPSWTSTYGGSTGYGRDYRRRLRGAWGIVDIDDVCAGALYLSEAGLGGCKRLAIDGGSAGGYTDAWVYPELSGSVSRRVVRCMVWDKIVPPL